MARPGGWPGGGERANDDQEDDAQTVMDSEDNVPEDRGDDESE